MSAEPEFTLEFCTRGVMKVCVMAGWNAALMGITLDDTVRDAVEGPIADELLRTTLPLMRRVAVQEFLEEVKRRADAN
jgi:hypothetical protein